MRNQKLHQWIKQPIKKINCTNHNLNRYIMNNKIVKMIKPNLIESKELEAIKEKHPNAVIPTEIPNYNSNYYNFMSLKLVKTGGIDFDLKVNTFTMEQKQYLSMSDEAKLYMASKYDKLVIIHDPIMVTGTNTGNGLGRLTIGKEKKIIKEFKDYMETTQISLDEKNDNYPNDFIKKLSEKYNVSADKVEKLLISLN